MECRRGSFNTYDNIGMQQNYGHLRTPDNDLKIDAFTIAFQN